MGAPRDYRAGRVGGAGLLLMAAVVALSLSQWAGKTREPRPRCTLRPEETAD
jgi:hypothetical protein